MPSLVKVPMTLEVKNPRESLTTMGVLPICATRARARPRASSEVSAPLMISTSGILSTGEKKCRPMKSAGRSTPPASMVMGRVEVLEHSSASGAMCGAISANTVSLTFGSSNTASMTACAPEAAAASVVGVMRARSASPFACAASRASPSAARATVLATSFSE